ncbi:protein suppressor of hairy wing [Drosophila sulfurigaster albostrigata]|uniref:protein suppressor of hairy wing n=1 Tax=Drosophila sulfurigaster albostrigata TaxID=89887 RepID=UPI002D21C16E|nr:protein suppressor of hairy wing [Drosophila sulfurigaster albostrigata]XP_062124418.1 protein suppressor of hairy wing [Drosophila sulfurigaster albostrigata]XP_062124419.1 protein suppressor of hairy wing [Drosophila sulfurigaster albostrigata]XP_062124420.1 protein suppressor of hairy wing [Drosophila sulfurigaster albostrigata]
MTENADAGTVIKILDVALISSPKDKTRTGNRMKLLNDVPPAKGAKKAATVSPRVKQEKRASIKILNSSDEVATTTTPKADKGKNNKTVSPTGSVKILNEKRTASSTATPTTETAKIKTSPSKKKKMDHYVLQAIKSENSGSNKADNCSSSIVVDEEDTIDFILAENDDIELAPGKANDDEFVVSGVEEDEDDDDDALIEGGSNRTSGNNELKEMVEHVCGKCYKTFRRVKSLKKHLEFCRYDSGYHLRKADMLKNLEKIERDAVVMEKKDICFCCSESYDTFHLGHINCPDCPKSFKTQTSYERHIFITHSELNDFPCPTCNAKLRSAALLKLHEEQHKSRGKPYACKICGKDFTRSYHLKRHQKYSSCSANENDTMSCKVCDRVFYRLDNLRAHLKQHLGTQVVKKPEYMCHVCKNCFYSLSTLNIHIRTHTGEKPFDCDLCDKKFSALVALKKHRRYHTGEKPYTCTVCSQSFAVKEVLNRHMKRHTGERPHKCPECGKSFIQATQLRTHSKTHLRPHSCTLCSQKFKTEKQLDRHAKEHTRAKRATFACTECTRSFRTSALLKEHMDAGDHSPVKTTRVKRTAKMIERTDCAICDKNFDSTETLRNHIRNVHECDPDDIFGTEPPAKRKATTKKTIVLDDEEDDDEEAAPANTSAGSLISSKTDGNGVVVREFLVDEGDGNAQTILLENEVYTILPLEGASETPAAAAGSDVKPNNAKEKASPVVSPVVKKEQRKSLAASLAAAIADNIEEPSSDDEFTGEVLTEEDLKLKENIAKLIDMLVDPQTLKKYNWPNSSEETVLCKVIENCGHDLAKGGENYAELDYGSRMREYCKLLFTVVIHNDSIKSLLNNFPIDDVIEYVLGDEDQDQDMEKGDEKEEDEKSDSEQTPNAVEPEAET